MNFARPPATVVVMRVLFCANTDNQVAARQKTGSGRRAPAAAAAEAEVL
jgi:hypothetical protein